MPESGKHGLSLESPRLEPWGCLLFGHCFQSGREDLNLRPHGPEPCALAKLSYAPIFNFVKVILPKSKLLSISTHRAGLVHFRLGVDETSRNSSGLHTSCRVAAAAPLGPGRLNQELTLALRAAITSGPDPSRSRLASSRSVPPRTPRRPFSLPRGRESGRGARRRRPAPAAGG